MRARQPHELPLRPARTSTALVLVALAVLAASAIGACGGDDGPAASHDADAATPPADTAIPDAADAADTAPTDSAEPPDAAPADTAAPVDTAPGDVAPACVVGASRCEGYLRTRCDDPARGYEVVEVCALGCDDAGAAPACATSCAPGSAVGCVNGSARRCGGDGASSITVACLGGCDGADLDCAPLGPGELEVYAANVAGVRVASVGGDDAGRLGFAWQANGAAEPVRLFVTDSDGNALSTPVALGGSGERAFAQLQVRGGPDRSFAVLGLDSAGAMVWHVAAGAGGEPVAPAAPLAAAAGLVYPSLVAWEGAVALYDLGPGEGGTYVRRTQWALSGGAPVASIVDGLIGDRDDVVAARVGADVAHVYSAVGGTVRVTTSRAGTPGEATAVFDSGEVLFANAAGPGASVLAAFDFADDPERAVIARFDGGALSDWADLGPARWLQATATANGTAVALQTADGVLRYAAWEVGATKEPVGVWVPEGGAERVDFWVVHDPVRDRVRLVTLGRDSAAAPLRVRISAP